MNKENKVKELKEKLLNMYPHLKNKEAQRIIKWLFTFWEEVLNSIEKGDFNNCNKQNE